MAAFFSPSISARVSSWRRWMATTMAWEWLFSSSSICLLFFPSSDSISLANLLFHDNSNCSSVCFDCILSFSNSDEANAIAACIFFWASLVITVFVSSFAFWTADAMSL
eukprot:Lithocolla_globosa_v1_NODE_1249_length_2736_cov_5.204028.p3 type:complete len:109 gc:universal NODE_1249_length_2736_cov_5.204028:1377-1703(+)